MGKKEKEVYCICRSTNGEGFMIQCEHCFEWFHGRCIKVKKNEAKKFKVYYCVWCREKDSGLTDVMYENFPEDERPKPIRLDLDEYKPLEERKQEKKPVIKKKLPQQPHQQQSTTSQSSQVKAQPLAPTKSSPVKRKPAQKARNKKNREEKKQCANPPCVFEARVDSKYCSDECGYAFNKLRYETHFIPKWKLLENKHSQARLKKMKDLDQLEKDKVSVEELIRNLKQAKIDLEENISKIKSEARRQAISKENKQSRENDDDDDAIENDDVEEVVTGDASKISCIMCGLPIPSSQAFKHWASCHRKQESNYNFTADVVVNPTCAGDENPKLYCHHQDKKTKRYCMHLESACPQHSNWHSDKDEVCGCPLNIMQSLVPDGNYCTELKKDCTSHYHWDKFRLAQLNMQRVQAFSRLDTINDRIRVATANLNDTYGGVVGVMLHNTIDHHVDTSCYND